MRSPNLTRFSEPRNPKPVETRLKFVKTRQIPPSQTEIPFSNDTDSISCPAIGWKFSCKTRTKNDETRRMKPCTRGDTSGRRGHQIVTRSIGGAIFDTVQVLCRATKGDQSVSRRPSAGLPQVRDDDQSRCTRGLDCSRIPNRHFHVRCVCRTA